MKTPKKPFDIYYHKYPELITILNKVFMDGGSAYNPRHGWYRRFRGWVSHSEWQITMSEACASIEELLIIEETK